MRGFRSAILAGGAIAAHLGGFAFAQETQDNVAQPKAAEQALRIDRVVVTAQKREQSLQDVPISVSVLDAEALNRSQVSNVQDLDLVSPSITVSRSWNPNVSSLLIRGIGTRLGAEGGSIQQSVVVTVDGVPTSRAASFWSDLVDIERIEVLRGPQGTLFGRNSTGGALNITTKAPTDDFGATVQLVAASDGELSVRGTTSGALAKGISGRLTGWSNNHDGYVENLGPHEDIGYMRSTGARGKLLFEPSEDISFELSADFARLRTNGQFVMETVRDLPVPGLMQADAIAPVVASLENDQVNVNSNPFSLTNQHGASGTLNWRISDNLDLVSITSYRDTDISYRTDVDQTPLSYDFANTSIFYLNYSPDYIVKSQTADFTQEVRLVGQNGPLEWIFGGFASSYTEDWYADTTFFASLAAPVELISTRDTHFDNLSWAIFADGTFKLSDTVSLLGGLRYTFEDLDYSYTRLTGASAAPTMIGPFTGSFNDDGLSARAGIQWEVTPSVNTYATYSIGYKGPALDFSSNTTANSQIPVNSESAKSFEVGVKSTLFNNSLRLNAALFRTEVEDLQAFKLIPPTGTQLINAGNVQSQGVELDATWAPTDNLTFDLSGVYDEGEYKDFVFDCYAGQTASQGCNIDLDVNGTPESQNLEGKPLADLPLWKISLSSRWDIQSANLPFDFYVNPVINWRDDIQHSMDQNPTTIQDAFSLIDINIGIVGKDRPYELTFFAKNVTDQFWTSRKAYVSAIGGNFHVLARDYERYYGVKLTVPFGADR